MAEKFIDSSESNEYKKRLAEFQQKINPKQFTLDEIEKIKQKLVKKRVRG